MTSAAGYVPPPYPYDRLIELGEVADAHEGGRVDLSVGTPFDPPPEVVLDAFARATSARGYPPSIGTADYRAAAAGWMRRRFDVDIGTDELAACIGTKELVVGLPQLLHLRYPDRDTVLYPAVSYPSYAMGAELAGLRSVPVAVDDEWRIDLDTIDPADVDRALCLWLNTPGNPAGGLDDLGVAASWGRRHGVPVLSDECYIEFTWSGEGRSILQHGSDGVLAVHSLSKRSNLAGGRAGFYAGDGELVHYLSELRKHAGMMVPGPVQEAAIAAWGDDDHVELQRRTYLDRLQRLVGVLASLGIAASLPGGGFYLWVRAPDDDAWALTRHLATEVGALVSPGEFYGVAGSAHVRIAAVQPDAKIDLLIERLGG